MLSQAWHAYALLTKWLGVNVFEKGEGSVEERLNLLYNESKHAESVIASEALEEDATIPVWLTNEGLRSHDAFLSYVELAEILEVLSRLAQDLQNPAQLALKAQKAASPE